LIAVRISAGVGGNQYPFSSSISILDYIYFRGVYPSHFRPNYKAVATSSEAQACMLPRHQHRRRSRPTRQDGEAGMAGAKAMLSTARVHASTRTLPSPTHTATMHEEREAKTEDDDQAA
jgi:hypothetical protein